MRYIFEIFIYGTVYDCLNRYCILPLRSRIDSHQEPAKSLFREPRPRLTSNNSVKNTIITAMSCLVKSLTILLTKIFFAASKLPESHFFLRKVQSSQSLYTNTRCKPQKYSQSHPSIGWVKLLILRMLWSLEGIYGFLVRIACICDEQRRDNRSGIRDPDSLIEKYRMLLHAICLKFKKIA